MKKHVRRMATLALYGPDDRTATKAVVGIFSRNGRDIETLHKWLVTGGDTGAIRNVPSIQEAIASFLKQHNVGKVAAMDRIIGCPHEEGKDYPSGSYCPLCPF